MAKKLKDLKWQTVALEGFPASVTENLDGFVGLEECRSYGLDKDAKRPRKKKSEKKRKSPESNTAKDTPNKKTKLSNGFVVETCDPMTPSLSNEDSAQQQKRDSNRNHVQLSRNSNLDQANTTHGVKKVKVKLGEERLEVESNLTPEDMLTWAEFKLPEPILKALTEMGFKQPTEIQQLSLPAAIHGRRDILGAAETGSGKTLAFGLPILTGIIKLKEKAELKGLDVYDIPYKKTSNKKRNKNIEKNDQKDKKDMRTKRNNKRDTKNEKVKGEEIKKDEIVKESSEDGYVSGEESSDSETEDRDVKEIKKNIPKQRGSKKESKQNNDEFLEEIEVPLRKKVSDENDVSSGEDSDENYVHLSEMLDSDDLAGSSSEEEDGGEDVNDEDDDGETSASEDPDADGNDDDDIGDETMESAQENEEGIGCVKVIDDIEIPGQVTVKTGKPLYALILTPTRELAIQISRHLIAVAKYTGIRIATIVGGMAAVKQERVLRCGPEVVVGTPGRLWELISQGQPHLQQLDCVKFLAIDETDRMLERGHFEELHPILERLNADEARQASRQNFVFSATLTMVHDLPAHMRGQKVTKRGKILKRKVEKMTPAQKIKRLVNMIGMTDPKVVDITTQNLGTAETLTESRIACSLEHKDAYLYYVLKRHPGRTIVFCNSIGCVRRLSQLLTILKCHPLPLHASMPQRQRIKNLERFRDNPHGVLVSTDVAARGLDIPNVDHVIHYQVPRTAENYVHRSGRTARAHKEGLTILLMEPAEAFLYSKLCRTLNKASEVPTFPVSPHILSSLKDLVAIARDLDVLELKKRRANQAMGWKEKAAKEMDMIIDEDDVPSTKADPTLEKAITAKKRQLNAMLTRPLFPQGYSFKYPTLNDSMALCQDGGDALEVMKKSIQTGSVKKQKRTSKNAPLLRLEKAFKKKKI